MNGEDQLADVPLALMDGLYTEALPTDLPAGASPLAINDDFLVGSVKPRPGLVGLAGLAAAIKGFTVTVNGKQASQGTGSGFINSRPHFGGPDDWILAAPGVPEVVAAPSGATGSSLELLFLSTGNDFSQGAFGFAVGLGSFGWSNDLNFQVKPINLTQLWSSARPVGYTPLVLCLAYAANSVVTFNVVQGGNGQTLTATIGSVSISGQCGTGQFSNAWLMLIQLDTGIYVAVGNNMATINFAASGFTPRGSANPFLQFGDSGTVSVPLTQDTLVSVSLINPQPNSPTFQFQLATGDSSVTVGTPNTNWGLGALLTAALLNNPNFGVNILASTQTGVNILTSISGVVITVYLFDGTIVTKHATVGTSVADGHANEVPWSNPGNIAANAPPTYATALLGNGPAFSQFLAAQAFGFALATGTGMSAPTFNANYLKTFEQQDGDTLSLLLGDNGVIYQEDVVNAQGLLVPVYGAILPKSFAQSTTEDDREFIAISDLLQGTDIPYTYDGTNFDRLSQVGPGAPPSCSTTSTSIPVVSVTQNPPFPLPVTAHDFLLVSDSPADHGSFGTPATPGNVMTLVFDSATPVPKYITPGSAIVLSGFPTINGNVVNNDPTGITAPKEYLVTSVGLAIPGQQSYDAITFVVNFTTFFNAPTPAGCAIRSTTATVTTAAQVPNLEVGGQFALAGTGGAPPLGYDGPWTVLSTPNAAQLQIVSTQLQNGIATYGFNLISGTPPVQGQAITVGQTLNGNGIFNVQNAIILTATAGTFTLAINAPPGTQIPAAAETGVGIIFGTIFTFDAGTIIGNTLGGTLTTIGQIASGIRKCCYSFLTRDGYVTKPSPIFTFDVPIGTSGIAVAQLLVGPPNIKARIIHLTAANGTQFYNIPIPVPFTDPITGIVTTSDSTYVNDNNTTNVVLSFTDDALLAAFQIDIQGENLFETSELGSPVGLIPYAARVFALGEQNKLDNWLNWSFDGGIKVINSAGGNPLKYPAGWTLDPATGAGAGVILSPKFGFSYSITNATGATQAVWGMITQPVFQDEFGVPIIEPSTTYSVRVTAAIVAGIIGPGALVVDLFSPKLGKALGTFTLNFVQLTGVLGIFTGTLLTTTLAPVPNDLEIRLYAQNIPNGVQILCDRVEPFPSEQPNLNEQLIGSYVNDFEAFDRVTGIVGCSIENQQPVKSSFTLYDSLYIVKEHSLLSVRDNKTTEPQGWEPRVVSNAVGTTSVYGVTTGIDEANTGEEWAVIAGQPGAFLFNGGQPIKLTEEIQSLWDTINWTYGHTLWVKNDILNRRILIGVPLKTIDSQGNPFPWLNTLPSLAPASVLPADSNPTTPNAIIMLSYKQLNTAAMLADKPGIRVSYSGKLIATEIVRKWAIWTIRAPAAAFLLRKDTTAPIFFGNSKNTGKIYRLVETQLVNGQWVFVDGSGPLSDDGQPFAQIYDTYGFIHPEQEGEYKMTSMRKVYEFMRLTILGGGSLTTTVFPNDLSTPYSHALLPNLVLPTPDNNGDVEMPVNEVGERLFTQYMTNAVGAGFQLSKVVMTMGQDPWSPTRGRN